jgi:hypothetical protein
MHDGTSSEKEKQIEPEEKRIEPLPSEETPPLKNQPVHTDSTNQPVQAEQTFKPLVELFSLLSERKQTKEQSNPQVTIKIHP